jgi:hypothetical protein
MFRTPVYRLLLSVAPRVHVNVFDPTKTSGKSGGNRSIHSSHATGSVATQLLLKRGIYVCSHRA